MSQSLMDQHFFGFNDLRIKGDLYFDSPGQGLAYGNIHVKDNSNAVTLNSSGKVQVTDFDTDGPNNRVTAVNGQDHLVILETAIYMVLFAVHVNNNASQSHVVDVSVWKNNGTVEIDTAHAHRTLTGGVGDIGSMSGAGLIALNVGDTLEMWADTSDAGDRSVTFSDVALTIIQIGG